MQLSSAVGRWKDAGATGALAAALLGCVNQGARELPANRGSYNEAIQQSSKEQLLLNLVRLRYTDTLNRPGFPGGSIP